jgi:hypothetical protein
MKIVSSFNVFVQINSPRTRRGARVLSSTPTITLAGTFFTGNAKHIP